MRWPVRILLALTALLLIGGMVFFGYAVYVRQQGNEYRFQVEAMLSAAAIANQEELTDDPAKAVIASYAGQKAIIHPENYRQLAFYLREDCVMSLFSKADRNSALEITFCGEDRLWASPADNSGDRVVVHLETGGKTFNMRIRGGGLWANLVACCTRGTYLADNLPLEAE